MINFHFDKEENILNIDYLGKIKAEDINDLYEKLLTIEFPDMLYIFQNEVDAEFIDSDNLIPIAVKFYSTLSTRHKMIEIAVWQTEPVKTAYSYMLKNNFDISNIQIEVFYTKKAAFEWLKKI